MAASVVVSRGKCKASRFEATFQFGLGSCKVRPDLAGLTEMAVVLPGGRLE